MRGLVCVICALGALLWAPGSGLADTADNTNGGPWLVLPATVGGGVETLHADAERIRQDLAIRGQAVWRADRAAERFEAIGSAPAPEISQGDIDRWVERSQAAVRYLARADYKAARRELKAAQQLADRAAAELNREAARAQQVLDTCLFMVRAYVETRNRVEARRQARECRRLVPRVEPTAFRHTPEVRDLLSQVDREMATEAPGSLSVQSSTDGCLVRINGVNFGNTPLIDVELPVGTYRLQVECEPEQRGRIHRIAVVSGANEIAIDTALDRVVRTRPVLHLQYEHEADLRKQRMRHGEEVARILESPNLLVISSPREGVLRIDMDAGTEAASVWLGAATGPVTTEDVRRGLDALLEGRSVDFSGSHPTAQASWRTEESRRAAATNNAVPEAADSSASVVPARPRPQRIAGWTLVALGVGSLGASVGLHVHRGTLGDRFIDAPANLQDAQAWQDARVPVWTLAGVGGASLTAAMPLVLPNRQRTPWWGWTLGAGGLGLGAYGIYQAATMTQCPSPFIADADAVQACVSRGQEAGRVAMSIAGAAPLLTVPLVYLFRPLRIEPEVAATREGAVLRLRHAF